MSIDHRSEGAVELVSFSGNLDASVAGDAKDKIQSLIDSGRTRLVLEFGDVRFVDSSGLSVLVAALKTARGAGGDIVLLNLRPEVRSIVELTRLHRILEIFDDSDAALAAVAAA